MSRFEDENKSNGSVEGINRFWEEKSLILISAYRSDFDILLATWEMYDFQDKQTVRASSQSPN